MLYHLSVFLPIGVFLLRRSAATSARSKWTDFHYLEALNFQLTILVCALPALIATLSGLLFEQIQPVAYFLWAITTPLLLYALIVSIIASGRARSGEKVPYPLTIRFYS